MDGWAEDATHCFLTGTQFTVVQRKHHCRYCGQIFITDVCKRMIKLPSAGFNEPVRVCDVCYEQVERGDPVCLSRQVAAMRADKDSARADAAKELANWASMDPQFAALASACQQLNLADTLTSMLGSSNAATQGAAASLLGAMLAYPECARHGRTCARPCLLACCLTHLPPPPPPAHSALHRTA